MLTGLLFDKGLFRLFSISFNYQNIRWLIVEHLYFRSLAIWEIG